MEFFIRKNSTLPKLQIEVLNESRFGYAQLDQMLSVSTITLSLFDPEKEVYKLVNRPAVALPNDDGSGFFISYQFTPKETSKEGRYLASFKIVNDRGEYIVPVNDDLWVTISNSFADSEMCCKRRKPINLLSLDIDVICGDIMKVVYTLTSTYPVDGEVEMIFDSYIYIENGEDIVDQLLMTLTAGESSTTYTTTHNVSCGNITTNSTIRDLNIEVKCNSKYSYRYSDSVDFLITPTPTVTPTNTPTPSVTPTNTPTPSVTPTNTPTPSITPTNTPTPSVTPTNTPTISNTPTNTPTISVTQTNTPTASVTPSASVTQTPTQTSTQTQTVTMTPSATQNATTTPTPTLTQTNTQTHTPTGTPGSSLSPTPTLSQTNTQTPTPTPTFTQTQTQTPTPTPTPDSSLTPTPTLTQTGTQTPTPTDTPGASPTSTPTYTPSGTLTSTPTATVTQTITQTQTVTGTQTPTPTITPTQPCCDTWDLYGGMVCATGTTFTYIDCDGLPQEITVPIYEGATICAISVTNTNPGCGGSENTNGNCICNASPTPTQSQTQTPTPTPTVTNTPTHTLTQTPTVTNSPTHTLTQTPTSTIPGIFLEECFGSDVYQVNYSSWSGPTTGTVNIVGDSNIPNGCYQLAFPTTSLGPFNFDGSQSTVVGGCDSPTCNPITPSPTFTPSPTPPCCDTWSLFGGGSCPGGSTFEYRDCDDVVQTITVPFNTVVNICAKVVTELTPQCNGGFSPDGSCNCSETPTPTPTQTHTPTVTPSSSEPLVQTRAQTRRCCDDTDVILTTYDSIVVGDFLIYNGQCHQVTLINPPAGGPLAVKESYRDCATCIVEYPCPEVTPTPTITVTQTETQTPTPTPTQTYTPTITPSSSEPASSELCVPYNWKGANVIPAGNGLAYSNNINPSLITEFYLYDILCSGQDMNAYYPLSTGISLKVKLGSQVATYTVNSWTNAAVGSYWIVGVTYVSGTVSTSTVNCHNQNLFCFDITPQPGISPLPTGTNTPTPSATPRSTVTPTPTYSPTNTVTPTITQSITPSVSFTPTLTPSPTQAIIPSDPSLSIYYDASLTSNFVGVTQSGDTFTQWTDSSATAHNANPIGGATTRPAWWSEVVCGLGGVKFDGDSDGLSVNPIPDIGNIQGFTAIILGQLTDNVTTQQFITSGIGSQSVNNSNLRVSGGTFVVGAADGIGQTSPIADTNPHMWSIVFDGSGITNSDKLKFYIDGLEEPLDYLSNVGEVTDPSIDSFYIGVDRVGVSNFQYYYSGFMFEVLLWTRTLTDSELSATHNYLINKWYSCL